ncbi:MAG: DNA polymerase III subunit beta [Candidatus Riflebacteria bacterium]|nr:DNA polymerase III subunit beta [Candidatus Riflebacteria bacterium]
MKFQLELKALSDALAVVGRAVAGKGIRPVLANVMCVAIPGELKLVGTDNEIMATSRLVANVEVPGQCTIPAKLLIEVVSSLPVESGAEKVNFSQLEGHDNQIELATGRGKFILQVQGTEEFPPLPVMEGAEFPKFSLTNEELKTALKEVSIAMGTEEANVTQRCVCFSFVEGKLRLVATDSRRLAVGWLPTVKYPPEFEKNFLVPTRAIPELLKILEDGDSIEVGLFKEQLMFTTKRFQMLTRLYEGKFPDYNRIMPKDTTRILTIRTKDLLQAIKAVAPIARSAAMMVHFDVGANETRIWSESPEEGNSEVYISTQFKGEPINIAFNGKYIQDFLGVVGSDELVIEMTTPAFPGLFRPLKSDSDYKCVIMPMTLNG